MKNAKKKSKKLPAAAKHERRYVRTRAQVRADTDIVLRVLRRRRSPMAIRELEELTGLALPVLRHALRAPSVTSTGFGPATRYAIKRV